MKKNFKRVSVRNSQTGKKESSKSSEFIKIIKENLETPIVTVAFCAISRPTYFPGSQVPRYKVCILFDDKKKEDKEFLKMIEKYATENKVETLGKKTQEGLIKITFQGKEVPKVYLMEEGKKRPTRVELEHDMPVGVQCKVSFDLRRYYDKYNEKNAFNFSPSKVTFYLDEETQEIVEVENGSSEDSRD